VCGFGGVLPLYKWIVERFNSSKGFDEAFIPPERNGAIVERAHKDYFDSWRKKVGMLLLKSFWQRFGNNDDIPTLGLRNF
jgi:hypothetical protein